MILALKKSSQQEFATALISLAKNPNEAARSFAVGQIKSVSSGPQKAAVIQAYLGDPSDAVRGITEQAYQENNTSDTFRLNMAVAASNNPNPVVRNTGFCNLWVVKDEHAVAQALRYYIDDPDKDIRATAVQMVSIFERQSLKASMLKPFLFDSDPEIVELAREKAMEMAPKWRDEVLSVLAPPEETVKKAEPVSERKPVKPTAPTVVRPDVQVAGPVKHGYRLDYMFQSAQTQLQEAAQGFAANQVYDPAIFMCRPTQSKRNWLFRRDDAGQPAVYEPIMNSDLRNLSKLLKLPQGYPGIEPLEGIYIFRGYQERFTRGGMGAYHILFNHGPNPFPVGGQELAPLNGDKDYSQFVTPEGEAASVDQISEMVRKALNEGSLLRLKVGKRKLVYFKLKGDKEKQKNRFYTVTMEYAYPDGRQIGRDIRTGVPYYKMHVVLGVYPGSNKAFLYTAFPTNGTVNIPPQLRQVVAEARHRRQAVKAAASLKSESPV
jgi:hypothetical protein